MILESSIDYTGVTQGYIRVPRVFVRDGLGNSIEEEAGRVLHRNRKCEYQCSFDSSM